MGIQKRDIPVNFAQGLDTKTDPKQISLGKFYVLKNSVFTKGNLLQKRNGFASFTNEPTNCTYLSTLSQNLLAIGDSVNVYSSGSKTWFSKGVMKNMQLDVLPLVRSGNNQYQADCAVAANGLICTVFSDHIPSGGSNTNVYKFVIADSVTGQNITAPTLIPSTGTVTYSPRVFLLGSYFIIVYGSVISATNHLQYCYISTSVPQTVSAAVDISTSLDLYLASNFDGIVANNKLYLAWGGLSSTIKLTSISSILAQSNTITFNAMTCTNMSVCADTSGNTPVIWASFFDSFGSTGYTLAVDQILSTVLAPTQWLSSGTIINVTSTAVNSVATIFYEVANSGQNYIKSRTCTQAGTLGTAAVVIRSLGLASKAVLISNVAYFLGAYESANQSTYFLCDYLGRAYSKLAYSNGGGYLYLVPLPSLNIISSVAKVPYLIKDAIVAVNSDSNSPTNAVYSQTGINLAQFTFGTEALVTAETGKSLYLNGGILWQFDGQNLIEQGFHVYPDTLTLAASNGAGTLTAQQYYYKAVYSWTDSQGLIHQSAPSLAVGHLLVGPDDTITVTVPTLRVTYKTYVNVVIYRWSTAQPVYYQVTNYLIPLQNSTTVDSVSWIDLLPDSSIVGNSILYTTGGVIENIGAPAAAAMALSGSRLMLIDAEDRNLVWFSKQVIEGTPVEMSDLFTLFVPPSLGASGNTGPLKCIAVLDDKTVLFKANAINYFTGRGPDNTGANNDFSDPQFINSSVGCSNQNSIVLIPNGLMFQSDKGIWLLDRSLNTTYIGADVEDFNSGTVIKALNMPGTTQVRFLLDNGFILMYDYFYGQWGSFYKLPAVSSTIYQGKQALINSSGLVFQETEGSFLDGAQPTLMSFTTGWINVAGLQGFIRAYEFYLLGQYVSPHKLQVNVAYDYNSSPLQSTIISPDNYSGPYGSNNLYGGGNSYGGTNNLEQWRIFLVKQKCEAFQITITELYDPSFGVAPGAGFNLSGINLTVGLKSTRPQLRANQAVG